MTTTNTVASANATNPSAGAPSKATKVMDPDKPVGCLLRMRPDYKQLLETIAEKIGNQTVCMEETGHEGERQYISPALGWTVPGNLNQLILQLSWLGLFRLWEGLTREVALTDEYCRLYEPALAWIAAHPDETMVPPEVLPPGCSRAAQRHAVLLLASDANRGAAELAQAQKALEGYYPVLEGDDED